MKTFSEMITKEPDAWKSDQTKMISEITKLIHHGSGNVKPTMEKISTDKRVVITYSMPSDGFTMDSFLMKKFDQVTNNKFEFIEFKKNEIIVYISKN